MNLIQVVAVSALSSLVSVGLYMYTQVEECVVTKAETDAQVATNIDYSQYNW